MYSTFEMQIQDIVEVWSDVELVLFAVFHQKRFRYSEKKKILKQKNRILCFVSWRLLSLYRVPKA